jgi:hypothetical protein
LAIVLIVAGLLIAGVLKGHQLYRQAKLKRQADDYQSLVAAVGLFHYRIGRLAGDMDGDGQFDSNDAVWADLESEDLAFRDLRSPYGMEYSFVYGQYNSILDNYLTTEMPSSTGDYVDRKLDDGNNNHGYIQSEGGYSEDGMVEVVHFLGNN